MEIVAIVLSIAALMVSALSYLKRPTLVVTQVITAPLEPVAEEVQGAPTLASEPESIPAPVPVDNTIYQGWRNVKEQPMVTPSTPLAGPQSGPLERPNYGFVR